MPNTPPVLTPRLQLIADQVKPCACMADIGTDHAYLPVWLCMQGKSDRAIASDIRQGPLRRAEATLARYRMQNAVTLRLGGGAEPLAPGEADCIVIAGMGGLMIAEILHTRPEVFAAARQVLIQPMSSLSELRELLFQQGWRILDETLAKEEDKLYHLLSVLPMPEETPPSQAELVLGKQLIQNRPPHFAEYLDRQHKRLSRMAAGLRQSKEPNAALRLEETEALLQAVEQLKKEDTSCNE